MNDSSNNGADFHCDPNSIITLKGEDLPQPRNGAPTTSDAYVSQLRSDPYAANLVLAVPGISTATGANLISNGTFENGLTGWTQNNEGGGTSTVSNNQLSLYTATTSSEEGRVYQQISVTSGQRYTVSLDTTSSTLIQVSNTIGGSEVANQSFGAGRANLSFTATASNHYIELRRFQAGTSVIDNVVVKQENVPIDYSADIKGSGTNKTLTANGNTGVGYELGGYYGSALIFPYAAGQRLATTSSDFAVGTGDFTVEVWINPDQVVNYKTIFSTRPNNGSYTDGFNMWINVNGATGVYSNAFLTQSANGAIVPNQWTHVVAERYNSQLTTYVNGVGAATATNTQNFTRTLASLGELSEQDGEQYDGAMQDVRVYKGVAKYKGGFDVPKPYTPVGIEAFRTTTDTFSNNFATLNPLFPRVLTTGTDRTFSNGNLTGSTLTSGMPNLVSSMGVSYGQKVYFEVRQDSRTGGSSDVGFIGVRGIGEYDNPENNSDATFYYGNNGTKYKYVNGTLTVSAGVYGDAYTDGDIIGISIDSDGTIVMYKNGVSQGTIDTYTEAQYPLFLQLADGSSGAIHTYTVNFGQNPTFSGQVTAGTNADDSGKGLFKYAPPSGFLALCEDNLPTPAIADPGDYMRTVLYTGDGNTGRSITGVGFKPDLVWIKERTSTSGHIWFDSVRGAGNYLFSVNTTAEGNATGALISFDSDGYSTGDSGATNENTQDYVAWCWKAGGAAVSNTDGTLTSQVSVNQDAGFSIITVDNIPASTLTNFGHGLNKKPDFIIFKSRNNTTNWDVYHSSLTPDGERKVYLNSTSAEIDSGFMGDTPPTSSLIYYNVGSSVSNHIAYCWTEIEGFSKFGSYVGNGNAAGPFVYCGFKPAWILIKESSGTGNWLLWDSSRKSINPTANVLVPNSTVVEYVGETTLFLDMLSNGFKVRATSDDYNGSGGTYIFMAFADLRSDCQCQVINN